ncbi:MAG: VWA domain-containing protein [Myxococcales bacterium]|nr:VWA domain-containing protein [Myxococcales bacterium]
MSEHDPFAPLRAALEASDAAPEAAAVERALRWRLILGQHADDALGLDDLRAQDGEGALDDRFGEADALELPLAFLYERQHGEQQRHGGASGGTGLTVPLWVRDVRRLFPREAVEVMERDALHRYGLTELVTDAEVLAKQRPSQALVKAIVQFKHLMGSEVLAVARRIVAEVVETLRASLETQARPALYGPARPSGRPPIRTARNVDWHRTIRGNLKHFDRGRERLVIERVRYRHRSQQRSPWRIVLAVDQSGSMVDSLIHAAVMAAIFAGAPSTDVKLVLWDHRVVDLSHLAADPLEVLMSSQLGGGTRLLPALDYCAGFIEQPARTILVVISDWYLADERRAVLVRARALAEAGVKCLGLTALDAEGRAVGDAGLAKALAGAGWFVGALTPKALAEHVGRILR